MFLKEFEGRALFRKYSLPVAPSVLLNNTTDFREALDAFVDEHPNVAAFVLKAQILSGKRGKGGGILFADRSKVSQEVDQFFGKEVNGHVVREILVQEKVDIQKEFYLSMALDRSRACLIAIFSEEGGVDIEELAQHSPEKILEVALSEDWEKSLSLFREALKEHSSLANTVQEKIIEVAEHLYRLCYDEEALLAEINPLILSKDDQLIAADSKVTIDNNALDRHPDYNHRDVRGHSALELEAREYGLAYVELDGNVAIIGNGAGLVMATLDAVDEYGGDHASPANFCDVGGGASAEMVKKALEIVLQKEGVQALFINVFGGITHCDEVAKGILDAQKNKKYEIPMVIRMVGTNDEEARKLLNEAGMKAYLSFEEAAKNVTSFLS